MHQEGPLLLCLLSWLGLSSAARTLLLPGLLLLCEPVIQCREASPIISGCCCSACLASKGSLGLWPSCFALQLPAAVVLCLRRNDVLDDLVSWWGTAVPQTGGHREL